MSVYDDMRELLAGLVTSDEAAERLDWMVESAEVGYNEAVMQCEHLERALSRMQDERDAALEALEGRVEPPVGADGLPIRVGDVVAWPDGETLMVEGISGNTLFYVDALGDIQWTAAGDKWHARDSFGSRLRRLLRERGMSQSDLARATDTSVASVSRWCTHERTPRYAQLVAVREALGCTWDELMGEV